METPTRMQILVVCTANICRSPMFAGLLSRDLTAISAPFEVSSAGLLDWEKPAEPDAVLALAAHGVDLGAHRSRPVSTLQLGSYDLILTMTREHLRELVIDEPELFPTTFTVKSFVRAITVGGGSERPDGFAARVRALGAGRSSSDMLGESPEDDVADPYQRGQQQFEATAVELADLSRQISLALLDLAT